MQKFSSEAEMIDFGEKLAKTLSFPAVIELVGDETIDPLSLKCLDAE